MRECSVRHRDYSYRRRGGDDQYADEDRRRTRLDGRGPNRMDVTGAEDRVRDGAEYGDPDGTTQ